MFFIFLSHFKFLLAEKIFCFTTNRYSFYKRTNKSNGDVGSGGGVGQDEDGEGRQEPTCRCGRESLAGRGPGRMAEAENTQGTANSPTGWGVGDVGPRIPPDLDSARWRGQALSRANPPSMPLGGSQGPLGGAGPGAAGRSGARGPPQWGGHECEGMCQAGGHSVSETLRNTILMKSAL